MKKLLLQIDSAHLASVFDAVVAYDSGADEVMSRGGVEEGEVRDLIHGCIFTRGLKDLKNTAVFIGGTDMSVGEKLLAAAQKAVFGDFRVSMMLDSNGSNTTAVAAVEKIVRTVSSVEGKRVLVTAGTGPVGTRAAGLLAKAGAQVTITSRKPEEAEHVRESISERFGGEIHSVVLHDKSEAGRILDEVKPQILLNTGPTGVILVPHDAWAGRSGLAVAADLNAVPPLGIEGIEATDNGAQRDGVTVFGALGVGNLKTKIHRRCIARLFESNDMILDAETIAEVAKELE
jgi:methylenetetrahydrofolate/methylenetetrahydromethanopterin dehydrogenase (NADP+)